MEKRRAHECAAGQPVKRDGGHLSMAPGRVKRLDLNPNAVNPLQ
jgi:hypothetical protein